MTFFSTTDTIKTTLKIVVLKQKAREREGGKIKIPENKFQKSFLE
jgi:hypothetical protein